MVGMDSKRGRPPMARSMRHTSSPSLARSRTREVYVWRLWPDVTPITLRGDRSGMSVQVPLRRRQVWVTIRRHIAGEPVSLRLHLGAARHAAATLGRPGG